MAFWGIEVKPGSPYTLLSKPSKGRLHVSQATLGIGSGTNKTLVQCNVGDKYPVFLCALLPGKTESCGLDLEFEEAQDVIFSVIGPRSVHLTGYYLPSRPSFRGDDESESFGEDIANSENDKSDRCSEDDEYEDSFIDDGDEKGSPGSPVSVDSDDVSKPIKSKNRRRLKKKHQADEPVGLDGQQKINHSRRSRSMIVESDDDDDIVPLSSLGKAEIKETKINGQSEGECKEENFVVPDSKESIVSLDNGSLPKDQQSTKEGSLKRGSPDETDIKEGPKTKKRKKVLKAEVKEGDSLEKDEKVDNEPKVYDGLQIQSDINVNQPVTTNKKKKKKKHKMQQDNNGVNSPLLGENGKIPDKVNGSVCNPGASLIKTLSNGLIIEDLKDGETDGKVACRGKKVKIKYVGKLKDGSVFESNLDESPCKFHLGDGKVIQGWDIGIEGMRVGGKRRLTIPPNLGYGSQGNGKNILPDSWLIYDIELVSAR